MLLVDFINVGYGDAVLIREMAGSQVVFSMLVDCGDLEIPRPPGSTRISAAEFLAAEKITRLDLLVLTHLHLDHVGGLGEVLRHCPLDHFWTGHLPEQTFWGKELAVAEPLGSGAQNLVTAYNHYSHCLKHMEEAGTNIRLIREPLCKEALGHGKLHCTVSSQTRERMNQQDSAWSEAIYKGATQAGLGDLDQWLNDASLRMRLSWNGWELELPGDLSTPAWKQCTPQRCHILKLPHHGHTECIDEPMLEHLAPLHSIICVSNNRPDDCPAQPIVTLLEHSGGEVSFTDAVGHGPAHHSVRFCIQGDRMIKRDYRLQAISAT